VLGEHLASIAKPMIDVTTLPHVNAPWQEEWTVNMKCLDGADAGVEVIYKGTTRGGIQAVVLLLDQIRERINSGQHEGKIAPIVLLEKDSYQHVKHGRVFIPVLTLVDWMSLDGPAPAPTPAGPRPPIDQPRRRRVA